MQAIRPKQETADNKEEVLRTRVRVFAPALQNGSDAPAVTAIISISDWHTLELLLPAGAVPGTLHIQPVNQPAVIEIREISVYSSGGSLVWAAKTLPELQALQPEGSLTLLPGKDRCLFFNFGSKPLLVLPPLGEPTTATTLRLVICVHKDCEAVSNAIATAHAEVYNMAAQVRSTSADRIKTLREYQRQTEAAIADRDSTLLKWEQEKIKLTQLADIRMAEILQQNRALESRLNTLLTEHESLRQAILLLEQSRSWRITRPLRSASILAQKLRKAFD